MQGNMQTVCEKYIITEEDLEKLKDRSEENKYWKDSYNFVRKIWNMPVHVITPAMDAWLTEILDNIQR